MKTRVLYIVTITISLLLIPNLYPTQVAGHPLGNFSLNHYNTFELQPGKLITHHVLDFAEIPSYNELAKVDPNGDNQVEPQELAAYKESMLQEFLPKLSLKITDESGSDINTESSLLQHEVILSRGQGSLTCLQIRLVRSFHIPQAGNYQVQFKDNVRTHIRGLKEIRIKFHPGITVNESSIQTNTSNPPIPFGDMFLLDGLGVSFSFEMKSSTPQNQDTKPSDIKSLIDPKSIPQFPLEPNENGVYEILKSPIKPKPEVQSKINMLQPRGNINSSDLLGQPTPTPADIPEQTTPPEQLHPSSSSPYTEKGSSGFTELISQDISPGFLIVAIFASILFGASHALSPGHGKTVVAAYLVGSRGTIGHAFFLGLVVTLTHVSSVLILGIITLFFSEYIMAETFNAIVESASGLLIVGIGLALFLRRYSAYQRMKFAQQMGINSTHTHSHHGDHDHHHNTPDHNHSHDHGHDHHHHDHPHEHDHHDHDHHHHHHSWLDEDHEHGPHTHTHEIPAEASWKDLLMLGITGGIVPCPSALVVLLVAISLHRILLGMMLIVFFSIGLAAVLITIGVLMVTAKRYMDRFTGRGKFINWLQLLSPAVVTLLGFVIFIRGLMTGGIISFNLPIE